MNPERAQKLSLLALGLLAATYCLQAFGPLRLNGDAIVLLSIASSVADGGGFLYRGTETHFPHGYPVIVAMLEVVGLASRRTLVFLNLFCMWVGLAASYLIYRGYLGLSRVCALALCCLTALSYVLVKHVTLPISDMVFFGLFAASLCLMVVRRESGHRALSLCRIGFALILSIAAITVRSAGVVLLPALLWALYRSFRDELGYILKRDVVVYVTAVLVALSATAAGLFFVSETKYFSGMMNLYSRGGFLETGGRSLAMHLTELGEVALNIPAGRAPHWMTASYLVAGSLLFSLVLFGVWARRRLFGAVELGMLAYMLMIFLWPYSDARFWLPVVPLLLGFVAIALAEFGGGLARLAAFAWCGYFSLFGSAALLYSSLITLSGDRFPDLYGDRAMRSTYRAFLTGERVGGESDDALYLLRRYSD